MTPNGNTKKVSEATDININKVLLILKSRWYIIAASLLVFLLLLFVFLKVTSYKYSSEALLRYSEQQTRLKAMPFGSEYGNKSYLAETYSMRSTGVIKRTLDTMHKQFYFLEEKGLRKVEIYPESPFTADITGYDVDIFDRDSYFKLKKNGAAFDLEYITAKTETPIQFKQLHEGSKVKVKGLNFVVTSPVSTMHEELEVHYISYYALKDISDRLVIKEAERELPILLATYVSPNKLFTRDFLKNLIHTFQNYEVDFKRQSSELTLNFINDQLGRFDQALQQSSTRLEDFKKNNELIDVGAAGSELMKMLSELQNKKYELEIQNNNIELLARQVNTNQEVVSDMGAFGGAEDPALTAMIDKLNERRADRKQLLLSYSPQSSIIRNIEDEIAGIKTQLADNIRFQKQRSQTTVSSINRQIAEIKSRINTIPTAEKDLVYLTSDLNVNRNIYTFLLDKKLETSVSKAGIVPSFVVIEYPVVSRQIFPRPVLFALITVLLGLVTGIAIILGKRALNTNFADLSVLNNLRVPILGILNQYPEDLPQSQEALARIQSNDTVFSETANAVRTNITYLAQEGKKIISITSEQAGEGKSFASLNIAVSLTRLNKKVIIVASDLRRSRLHKYFNDPNRAGLSTYLANTGEPISNIIHKSGVPGLDYISSGPVPLNPSELLYQDRFWSLLDQLKESYDYILIDTAPIGLVSDSIPILRRSDLNIFVLRWLFSNQDAYELPVRIANEYDLNNIYILINDYKKDDLYGSLHGKSHGGYSGYYANYSAYHQEEEKGLRRFFKRWGK